MLINDSLAVMENRSALLGEKFDHSFTTFKVVIAQLNLYKSLLTAPCTMRSHVESPCEPQEELPKGTEGLALPLYDKAYCLVHELSNQKGAHCPKTSPVLLCLRSQSDSVGPRDCSTAFFPPSHERGASKLSNSSAHTAGGGPNPNRRRP